MSTDASTETSAHAEGTSVSASRPAGPGPSTDDPGAERSADRTSARMPSLPPPHGSLRESIGEACGLALAACSIGSIPAALRVARAGGPFLGGLLATTAVVLPAVAGMLSLGHAAGRGFRMVTGLRAGRSTAVLIALWIGLVAPVLVVLGALLKAKTSHRGLGGTTFGVLALAVAVLCALVAHRLVETGRWLVDRGTRPRLVATGIAFVALAPMILVSLPLLRHHDESAQAPAVAAALIDGIIFAIAGAVALTYDIGDRAKSFLRRFGLGAAAVWLAVGLLWLSVSPRLAVALRSGGGLAAALVSGLERWTDRDGDGFGAHFGGRDCDDGDPRVHPGAADPPGDGIDQDCDGVDGVATQRRSEPAPESSPPVSEPTVAPEPPAPPSPAVAAKRPSIVLVTLDTVRADHTSAYGYEKKTTPNLEELAAQGTLFEVAYAPASDSQRALLPLFTAVSYRDSARTSREWPSLRDEASTLAERVHAAGYRTVFVSSFQWLSEEHGFNQGFDEFVEVFREEHPERGVTGPLATRAARAAIEKAAQGTAPLFLWVHLFDAHEQYRRHDGFSFGRGHEGAYDSEIGFVDKQLGEIRAAVLSSSLKDNVVFIVHGSQGEAFGEHEEKGHGKNLFDEVTRVPLVVSVPGAKPHRVGGRAVSTLDVVSTVLDLTGADGGEQPVGISLVPAATGAALSRPPVILRNAKHAAVIDWPLKLIVTERQKRARELLFDLSADPKERHDISAERREDVARLRAMLEEAGAPREKRN